MIASFVITFRETLEAALIVGIVLSYLNRTSNTSYNNIVYIGSALAIIASLFGAVIFNSVAGGYTGRAEEIFEGVTMLVGALLLTFMIIWMMRQKHLAGDLEGRVATEHTEAHRFGLFFLVFVAILREGIETVIFLQAASIVSEENNLVAALSGVLAAAILGYAMFIGSMKVNLKRFFNATSVLLILFAAGLVAHGVHELQEARIIPTVIEHLWDINPALNGDASFPLMHEKGYIGSVLKGLFGYNGNPSLIEVLNYVMYIAVVSIIWWKSESKVLKTA